MAASRRGAVDPVTPVQRTRVFLNSSCVKPCTLCPESAQDGFGNHDMSTCSTSSPSSSSASPWQDASLALLPVLEESGLRDFSVVSADDVESCPLELRSIRVICPPQNVYPSHERRRLLTKHEPPSWYMDACLSRWSTVSRSSKWKCTRQALDEYRTFRGSVEESDSVSNERGYYQNRKIWSEEFKTLSEIEKVRWYLGAHEGLPYKRARSDCTPAWAQQLLGTAGRCGDKVRMRGCLITWNGDWAIDCAVLAAVLTATGKCSIDESVTALQKVPFVEATLKTLFESFMASMVRLNCVGVTVAVELSTHATEKPRIHFHAFLHASTGTWLSIDGGWDCFRCGGVDPSHAVRANGDSDKVSRFRCMEGHYYLQFAKIGHIMHFTNYASFEAFVPKRSWMLSKFQMGKMSGEAYLAEAMKLKQGSIGIVREAEHQLKLLQQTDLENELQRIEQAFEKHRRPSIPHPPMVQDFVSQFRAENFGVAARFKPLVLDGPTRFGKSTFAESLFGTENTIFINCQNTLIPPMQRYKKDWRKYSCIVFEEVDHRMVCGNKLLFQGTRKLVDMGISPTEQHAFTVLVYFKAMVLCSNRFLNGIDDEDRDYIMKNVYYYRVEDYLYQRD